MAETVLKRKDTTLVVIDVSFYLCLYVDSLMVKSNST